MVKFKPGDRVFPLQAMNGVGTVECLVEDGSVTVQFDVPDEVKYVCSKCGKDPHPARRAKATKKNRNPKPIFLCEGATRVEKMISSGDPHRINFKPHELAKVKNQEHLEFLISQRNKAKGLA